MSTTFEIPTLHTGRLTLPAFQAGDLDALATMQANPEVRRFLGGNLLTRAEAWSSMERTWANGRYAATACSRSMSRGTAPVGPACCIRWNGRNRNWPIRSISHSGGVASPPKRFARRAIGPSRGSTWCGWRASSCRTMFDRLAWRRNLARCAMARLKSAAHCGLVGASEMTELLAPKNPNLRLCACCA